MYHHRYYHIIITIIIIIIVIVIVIVIVIFSFIRSSVDECVDPFGPTCAPKGLPQLKFWSRSRANVEAFASAR